MPAMAPSCSSGARSSTGSPRSSPPPPARVEPCSSPARPVPASRRSSMPSRRHLRPPVRLVRGDCDALETPSPLAPIADLAWTLGGELEQLIERSAPVHEIAGAVLDGLSPRRVIVIEDLHWADAATLDVVRLVCRRLPRATGLLIVTYRDDQIGRVDPLRVLLGEVSSMPGVSRLHLDPLSQDAVAAAGRRDRPRRSRAAPADPRQCVLRHRSAGRRRPVDTGHRQRRRPGPRRSTQPRTAADCSTPWRCSKVLSTLHSSPTMAGDAAGSIEECCANGLLVDSHLVPGSITFRHELARRALEEAMPAHRPDELPRPRPDGVADERSERSGDARPPRQCRR